MELHYWFETYSRLISIIVASLLTNTHRVRLNLSRASRRDVKGKSNRPVLSGGTYYAETRLICLHVGRLSWS